MPPSRRHPPSPMRDTSSAQHHHRDALHWGFVIAVAVGLILYLRPVLDEAGFRLRAVGCNLTASRFQRLPRQALYARQLHCLGAIAPWSRCGAEPLGTQSASSAATARAGSTAWRWPLIGQLHPVRWSSALSFSDSPAWLHHHASPLASPTSTCPAYFKLFY